jgi:hypothetical protein
MRTYGREWLGVDCAVDVAADSDRQPVATAA